MTDTAEPTPNTAAGSTGPVGVLTDGSGVSKMLGSKVVKDFVLDALLSVPVSLAVINIGDLQTATAAPIAVAFAVGDALIRVLYRAGLRWAQAAPA